jgi:hypothetical protein
MSTPIKTCLDDADWRFSSLTREGIRGNRNQQNNAANDGVAGQGFPKK